MEKATRRTHSCVLLRFGRCACVRLCKTLPNWVHTLCTNKIHNLSCSLFCFLFFFLLYLALSIVNTRFIPETERRAQKSENEKKKKQKIVKIEYFSVRFFLLLYRIFTRLFASSTTMTADCCCCDCYSCISAYGLCATQCATGAATTASHCYRHQYWCVTCPVSLLNYTLYHLFFIYYIWIRIHFRFRFSNVVFFPVFLSFYVFCVSTFWFFRLTFHFIYTFSHKLTLSPFLTLFLSLSHSSLSMIRASSFRFNVLFYSIECVLHEFERIPYNVRVCLCLCSSIFCY